jgi:hypothetical protein
VANFVCLDKLVPHSSNQNGFFEVETVYPWSTPSKPATLPYQGLRKRFVLLENKEKGTGEAKSPIAHCHPE